MTLIILLCALGVEYFLGVLDTVRRMVWFSRYSIWLENKCVRFSYSDGAIGTIMVLVGPLILLLLINYGLKNLFLPLSYLFALVVLVNSIGPVFLNQSLDDYAKALDAGDDVEAKRYAEIFCRSTTKPDLKKHEQEIIECIFVEANERLYAVIFWFVVLGPFGAMLYRLVNILRYRHQDVHGAYADSIKHLSNILDWPVARLFVLGNALVGHMPQAVVAWKASETMSFESTEAVLRSASLGALHYPQAGGLDKSYWIKGVQALINRTLIIWLTVLGIITIMGVLA